jgi:sRNA-binding regulator protein Hfq
MSYETSMLYTMGMALNRALDNHAEVSVLTNGQWLSGAVVVSDGYGVVLDNGSEHSIVKVDSIAAVRIMSMIPHRHGIENGHDAGFTEPMPMPGPRMAATA